MTLKLIQSHRKLLCRCSHCGTDSRTSVRMLRSFRFQWKHQSSGDRYGICVVEDILHEGWKRIMEKLLQNQLYNELYKKHFFHKCIQLISSKHCHHIQPHASLWPCQYVPMFFASLGRVSVRWKMYFRLFFFSSSKDTNVMCWRWFFHNRNRCITIPL